MFKKIAAFDGVKSRDNASIHDWYDTRIVVRSLDTGEVLFKGKNKVVVAGGETLARKLFDLPNTDANVIPSYNTELGIPDPGAEDADAVYEGTNAKEGDPKVLLFAVGTDGCGTEGSQVYVVDYNSRIRPDALIPFRYCMKTSDLSDELQKTYVGRKEDGDYVGYYFKRFSSDPTLFRSYPDGTPIDGNLYNSGLDVEQFVRVVLTITKEDLREFFIATTGIDECRLNTISLCTAYPRMVDGKIHYMDIRPLTKLNLPNEYMIDVTKGIEVTYDVFV